MRVFVPYHTNASGRLSTRLDPPLSLVSDFTPKSVAVRSFQLLWGPNLRAHSSAVSLLPWFDWQHISEDDVFTPDAQNDNLYDDIHFFALKYDHF